MRVLVDATGAEFGGIRTYVENLLAAWPAARPEDELLVVADAAHGLQTGPFPAVELEIPRPAALTRPALQSLRLRREAAAFGADVALATFPSTTILDPGVPLAVVVHDLRHELRPDQFSRSRRLLRAVSYRRSYALASGLVAVSERTRGDLVRLHPELVATPVTVVHHGADHALSWKGVAGTGPAVTFAHHTNKNSDLVIEGWARAVERGLRVPRLVVLGGSSRREELAGVVRRVGLEELVEICGWLPEAEFQRLVASASAVVLSSDFEGFGLPVLEGMVRGTPVVIGPDPAMLEVAGGHASVMADWTPEALAEALGRALELDQAALAAGQAHAAEFTWARTAARTGAALEALR